MGIPQTAAPPIGDTGWPRSGLECCCWTK